MAILKRSLRSLVVIYVGVTLGMMFLERSIIYPAPNPKLGNWQPQWLDFEDAEFLSQDGTRLHGWFVEHPRPVATLLVFHGNGEDVSKLAHELKFIRDDWQVSVMAFDYRGYGKSGGQPFEQGVLEDGEAAQRWLAERTEQEPEAIMLYGRSLGGAVAVNAAAKLGARGLILDRTFDSIVEVAASHFRWLPVRWLMRNRYPSAQRIVDYRGPVLQLHGEPDRVVPFASGLRLFEAAPSTNKKFIRSKDLDHNDAWPAEFTEAMREFLRTNG